MNIVAEKVVSFSLSKGGVAVRWIVGYIIAAVAAAKIVPDSSLDTIRGGLEAGGMSVLALVYAWFQMWIHKQQQEPAKALQSALNKAAPGSPPVTVDGWIGNETIEAFTERTGIEVRRALPVSPR